MKQYFRIYAAALFAAVFSVSAGAQITGEAQEAYRIGFQDVVEVRVFGHSKLDARVPVNPNGMIYLSRLDKPIKAICKTERELALDVENAYRESYLKDPRVTVMVAEQRSQSVSIIGAVDKPGRYPVSRRVHLLEALAMAGGPTRDSGTRLLIARAGSDTNCQESFASARRQDDIALIGFKIRDIQEGRKSFWMLPGDIVSVLESDVVYVYGNVEKPGEIRVREPITLTQAIASSQGLKSAAEKDKVRILRQKPDSIEREEIVINLRDVEKGKANDPYLEPNDIVAVSKDGTKAIMDGLVKTITAGVPSLMQRTVAPY
jgi:polysaccharide biosynthesis/export protein